MGWSISKSGINVTLNRLVAFRKYFRFSSFKGNIDFLIFSLKHQYAKNLNTYSFYVRFSEYSHVEPRKNCLVGV